MREKLRLGFWAAPQSESTALKTSLYERLKRIPKHDMDFVTCSKFRPLTKHLFIDLGYEPYISLMLAEATGRNRQRFNDKEGNKAIDVFLDRLEMYHVLDFKDRLEVDSPSVPLAELLLQKFQVVQTNEKDIQMTEPCRLRATSSHQESARETNSISQ